MATQKMAAVSAEEFVYIILSFLPFFVGIGQPTKQWTSRWYAYVSSKSYILSLFDALAFGWWIFPAMWTIVYASAGTAVFLFWRDKESTGEDFTVIMFLFIGSFLASLYWPRLVWWGRTFPGTIFLSSLITFGASFSALVLAGILLGAESYVVWFWLIFPLWSGFAVLIGLDVWATSDWNELQAFDVDDYSKAE